MNSTYIHTCIQIHNTHTHIYIYIYMYMHICMYMYACTHTHTYACKYKHTGMYTFIRPYIRTCIHMYIRTCIHMYIHTHIHHLYMCTCIHDENVFLCTMCTHADRLTQIHTLLLTYSRTHTLTHSLAHLLTHPSFLPPSLSSSLPPFLSVSLRVSRMRAHTPTHTHTHTQLSCSPRWCRQQDHHSTSVFWSVLWISKTGGLATVERWYVARHKKQKTNILLLKYKNKRRCLVADFSSVSAADARNQDSHAQHISVSPKQTATPRLSVNTALRKPLPDSHYPSSGLVLLRLHCSHSCAKNSFLLCGITVDAPNPFFAKKLFSFPLCFFPSRMLSMKARTQDYIVYMYVRYCVW